MIKLNKLSLFIFLTVSIVLSLALADFAKAGSVTCEAYCQSAGYDRGLCSTSCSVYPACLYDTCYYNCSAIYGQYPCDYTATCLCVNSASCSCSTKTCSNSGCQTAASKPSVTTVSATSIASDNAMLNGNITSTGGATVTIRGFHFGLSTTGDLITTAEGGSYGTGAYSVSAAFFTPGVTYYFRAFATNSAGTGYGSWLSFKAASAETFDFSLSRSPTSGTVEQGESITTTITTSLTSGSAQSVSFSPTNLPTGATATFSPTSCSPTCSTTLTINTLASTPTGSKTITVTATGGGKTKTTSYTLTVNAAQSASVPSITTNAASSITATTATLNGSITSIGGADIMEAGFDWGTSSTGYTWRWTATGYGIGALSQTITGLTPGTKYYFRAKARNSAGWGYGSQLSFTATSQQETITIPSITTNAASSITSDKAALNGTITNIGGESVTTRGFQYGLSQTPSITASSPGSFGTGAYSLDTLALNANTKYYFRAFATNSAGTGYGSWLNFMTVGGEATTTIDVPTVTTNAATSITTTSATLNGKIDSTGGSSVLEKGFDWGTSSGSLANELTQTGTYSTGSFTKYLSGLTPGTKYYFQAKARNSSGWDYGSELSFTAGTAPLYFSLSSTPTSDTVAQGDSAQTSITATLTSGSADSVSFEASNLPTGATATFSPTSCTLSCTSVLTIDTSNSTPVSSKTITIKAIGGPTTKSTTFYLKITAASEETTTKPSVTTNAATSITNTSATLNGKINSIGSSSVLEKGFDWGTSSGSLINEWKQAGTFSAGSFSKSITGLTAGTKYYYKAKARNSSVWVYGSQLSFTAGTTSTGDEDEVIQQLLLQIQLITAQIAQLQAQIAALTGTPVSWCHTFNTNLAIGVSGPEVEALQSALEKQGLYRKGTKSSSFDESLASAVVGFQQKYSSEILTPWRLRYGTGFVGNTTRTKLNALYGCR